MLARGASGGEKMNDGRGWITSPDHHLPESRLVISSTDDDDDDDGLLMMIVDLHSCKKLLPLIGFKAFVAVWKSSFSLVHPFRAWKGRITSRS